MTKSYLFLHKIRTKTFIRNLRHGSLKKNLRAYTEFFKVILQIVTEISMFKK